jgi:phage tail-like protein
MGLFGIGDVGRRRDPLLNHNFQISLVDTSSPLAFIGSVAMSAMFGPAIGGFSECTGLEMTMQAEEYKEGGRNGAVLKFPNRVTWSPLTLKRGIAVDTQLWDWFYGFVQGTGKRRDGVVTLMDASQSAAFMWFFRRGLPTKWTGPALNAAQSNVAIEAIEIAHEGIHLIPGIGAVTSSIGTLGGLIG